MKNAPCFLYIPVPSFAVGRDLAYGLVENRKVACVNIIPGMVSIYRWQGKIEETEEAVLLVKTLEHAQDAVITYMQNHHPYSCPVILPLIVGSLPAEVQVWLETSLQIEQSPSSLSAKTIQQTDP